MYYVWMCRQTQRNKLRKFKSLTPNFLFYKREFFTVAISVSSFLLHEFRTTFNKVYNAFTGCSKQILEAILCRQ